MPEWRNLDELQSFDALRELPKVDLAAEMAGENGARRVSRYSVPMAAGLAWNYGAKAVDDRILSALGDLAREADLTGKFRALYEGERINTGENRLVLHHLTRG